MNKFLTLITESLFFTHIWIAIYVFAVDNLYFHFRPQLTETFYRNPLANPEPHEISLYLLLTAVFVVTMWCYSMFVKDVLVKAVSTLIKKKPIQIAAAILFFVSFLLFFLKKLGTYPLFKDIHPYNLQHAALDYWVGFLIYLAGCVLFASFAAFLTRILFVKKMPRHFLYIGLFAVLAVIFFEPGFAISRPDAAMFYGPVYEVSQGKTLFTQAPSQYGFLSILFFAFIHQLTSIDFVYLPFFILIAYCVTYTICFYLFHAISKSAVFAAIGLLSIITINYFSATYGPQSTPLRWLPIFLTFFVFYKLKRLDNKAILFLIPLLSLWNIDAGISLAMTMASTIFLLAATRALTVGKSVYIGAGFMFFGALLLMLVQVIHIFLGLNVINFAEIFSSLKKNAVVAILMVPMSNLTFFWYFVFTYFTAILFFLQKKTKSNEAEFILLSAQAMLFASIYYVGRSMPHELYTISIFVISTFFYILGTYYRDYLSQKQRAAVIIVLFIMFIAAPAFFRKEYIFEKIYTKAVRVFAGNIFSSDIDKKLDSFYKDEIALIKNEIQHSTVIISADDTYLFYKTRKKNSMHANPIFGSIDMKSEMDEALKPIFPDCPKKIVVDCALLGKCQSYKSFSSGEPAALHSLLQDMQTGCGVEYKPTKCTKKLCIAEYEQ